MKKLLIITIATICGYCGAPGQSAKQSANASPQGGPAWASKDNTTGNTQSTKGENTGDWAWTVQPFDHKIFIENQGQFDQLVSKKTKVLFGAQLGDNLFAYFTTNGIIYRQCVYPKLQAAKKEISEKSNYDPDKIEVKPVITYLSSQWLGSNPNVTLDAKEERSDYYSYPIGQSTVKVNIFKKITYKNLYPGIDAEYTFFPDKQGFKYALIVHPGADISKVKLKYQGSSGMQINSSGDITIKSNVGDIIDHAPVSMYQEGANVNSSYNLTGTEESFNVDASYDNTKTLVIDPWTWTSSPGLATNKAYDLDYDKAGNVYVYGSSGTWQLAKFTSGGVKLWTYNATPISTGYYGDFACDKLSGKCYCTEGFDASGMQSIEVSTAGVQLSLVKTIAQLQEGWRDAWDPCDDKIVIGGGSWQTTCDAGGMLDTNNNITPINVLNENATEEGHDMALTCVDPNGTQCYMASTQSAGDPTNFNNIMTQLPVPTLIPFTYQTPTGYTFQESNVAQYVGVSTANGLNGMAASPAWLYIYDGAKLKRVNKGTGAIISTVVITATSENWGGLDVDNCDNIYVGENSAVQVYSSGLTLTTTYATSNTVYDVVLGTNFQTLYACGNGFLSSMPLPAPSYTIKKTRTNASCGCTGTASAQLIACGNPVVAGVTYSWSSGQTTSSVTALCAGTYTINITTPGCPNNVYTDTILIKTVGGAGPAVTTVQTNVSCNGGATGSATASATGGTLPYTYSWTTTPIQTSANATGLSAGTYTVTVTDAFGCSGTATVTITQPTAITTTTTSTPTTCVGNTGTATTNPVGGTPGYKYVWTPSGQSNATATSLTVGTYTVTITDANGCTLTATVAVASTSGETATTNPAVNVSCNGGSNGSDSVTVTGGTTPYTYSWSTIPIQTNAKATGLSAGTYTVTVTDNSGCVVTASVTVTQPTAVTVTTAAPTNDLCNGGNNGNDLASGAGGTGPYAYSWTTLPVQTNANATGLTAGTYTVTTTDHNGCTATASVTITQPTALSATTTTVGATCGKSNGSATATPSGGTGAYTYSWNSIPIQTTATASNLSAGTYTVTVTDANGCVFTTTATVINPASETVTINPPVNVLCNGGNNGSATPTVVGGATPYTYSWSTLPVQTNATATNLTAGTYTLTVTDANGCIATASVTITQPPILKVTAGAPVNILCNGGNNGSDLATPIGGTAPYLYSWTTAPIQTNASATGLTAGTYTVNVTDANGCTASATVTITQPPALTLVAAGFAVSCNGGNNGQATAIPGGGTLPYAYSWSNGATTANINNLIAGSYKITITDANGCVYDTTVVITQPLPIVVSFTADTINGCAPLCTGLVDASTDPGGTITKWKWNYSDGGSDTIQNPRHCFSSPGSYTVTLTVTDNKGCTNTLTVPNIITVYSSPTPSFTMSPQPTTIMNPTIQFTDKSTDAYGIASWLWNFADPLNDVGSNLQNPNHKYGDSGTYCATLTVTNIHGCVDSITECLVISPQFTLYIPDAFTPNGDGQNDIFMPKGAYVYDYNMYVFDRWGMMIFHSTDLYKGWNGSLGGNLCQEDTYVYLISCTDNLGQKHSYIGKVTLIK